MAKLAASVWLGLAGDLAGPDAALDHYSTRIGGYPVFPGPQTPPQWVCPKCEVCGAALSLVLQAYAPLPQLPDRVVLLFGCTKAGCGKSPGCWRALRCQQPAHKPQPQQQQQQQQQEDSTSSSQQQPQSAKHVSPAATGFDAVAADGNWGFGDASGGLGGWDLGQTTGATSSSTNAFDFSDLAESLSAVVQQQQDHHHHHQQQQQQQQKQQQQREQQAEAAIAGAGATAASSKGTAGPALPEFYLYAEVEPDASNSKAIPSKELQHVQQLLAAYEANEGLSTAAQPAAGPSSGGSRLAPAAAAAAAAAGSSAAAAAAGAGGAGEEGGASWAGEEYEPDAVGCMQRSYLKFMKRVARQPQQCARYCHNGPLLWPKVPPPKPSPCASCGVPRVFELQLMPALSHLVLEAAGMMQEQLGQAPDAAVVNAVANWDLCTVAVFTCQASCSESTNASEPDQTCQVMEEEALVVFEAECENGQQAGGAAAAAEAGPDAAEGDADAESDADVAATDGN